MCMKVVGGGVTLPAAGEAVGCIIVWSDLVSKEAIVSCLGQLMKIKIIFFFFSFFSLLFFFSF